MNIVFDTPWLVSWVLLTLRFSALLLLSPLFSITQVPVTFRILFVFAFSALILNGFVLSPSSDITSVASLTMAAINELFLGSLMAFGLFTAFGAFLVGGRVLDFQMGFGVASLIDPATRTQGPMLGTILNLMGVMTFFLIDGHHWILRGMVFSLEKIPLGAPIETLALSVIVSQFGVMFSLALTIIAPALMVLLLLDVAMAMAARTMPQVNMFLLSIPIKICVGILVLATSLYAMSSLLDKIFLSIFYYWQELLG